MWHLKASKKDQGQSNRSCAQLHHPWQLLNKVTPVHGTIWKNYKVFCDLAKWSIWFYWMSYDHFCKMVKIRSWSKQQVLCTTHHPSLPGNCWNHDWRSKSNSSMSYGIHNKSVRIHAQTCVLTDGWTTGLVHNFIILANCWNHDWRSKSKGSMSYGVHKKVFQTHTRMDMRTYRWMDGRTDGRHYDVPTSLHRHVLICVISYAYLWTTCIFLCWFTDYRYMLNIDMGIPDVYIILYLVLEFSLCPAEFKCCLKIICSIKQLNTVLVVLNVYHLFSTVTYILVLLL